jgi:ribosomal small subunit protein bTHX
LARPKEFINFVGQSCNHLINNIMGKGDKKTKRGKILMGSYGVRRRRKQAGTNIPVKSLKEEVPVKAVMEKPATKHKAEKEEILAEAPVIEAAAEVAEKPAKKKAPPKAKTSAKKEDKTE